MTVGEYCNRDVAIVAKETEIREAARLLRRLHVGDLVVVENRNGDNIPVGMLTDRDLVVEVLAQEVDLDAVTVADIMSIDPMTARESDDLWDTVNRMRAEGVRRLPVVNARGGLVGILTADDMLDLLAEGLNDVVKLIKKEIYRETQRRP